MLVQDVMRGILEARTIDMIAQRVLDALRDDLETIAAELSAPSQPAVQLTVEQVARRLGVARSTVYTHWREWGGYKLGRGQKSAIRFDWQSLLITPHNGAAARPGPRALAPTRRRARRRPRDLVADAPRFAAQTDELA